MLPVFAVLALVAMANAEYDAGFEAGSVGQFVRGPDQVPCHHGCNFHFCNEQKSFRLNINDLPIEPFTRAICANNVHAGVILRTGEAVLVEYSKTTPISEWEPSGHDRLFRFDFFHAVTHTGSPSLSGMGHKSMTREQMSVLHNRCFAVPILDYQVLHNGEATQAFHVDGYTGTDKVMRISPVRAAGYAPQQGLDGNCLVFHTSTEY